DVGDRGGRGQVVDRVEQFRELDVTDLGDGRGHAVVRAGQRLLLVVLEAVVGVVLRVDPDRLGVAAGAVIVVDVDRHHLLRRPGRGRNDRGDSHHLAFAAPDAVVVLDVAEVRRRPDRPDVKDVDEGGVAVNPLEG